MIFADNNISNQLNTWVLNNSYSKIFILLDENIKASCLPKIALDFKCSIIEIESGEKNKNLETCQYIWNELLQKKADRKSLVINFGGGVICDIGGFCASTFKRGIAFINIPTTLLAQVDASVGSKTGIDFQSQKNMIGLFSESKEIFIDTNFLKTLSKRELLSGFAEVLKHGLIDNEKYFTASIQSYSDNTINWLDVVKKSIEIKSKIVAKDPKENGLRKILNFGHTFGHAYESYALKFHTHNLLHGEAVIIGIISSLYLSVCNNFISRKKCDTIISKLLSIYNFDTIEKFDTNVLINFILNDKKNNGNKINYVILENIGNPLFDFQIDIDDFIKSYDFINQNIFNND